MKHERINGNQLKEKTDHVMVLTTGLWIEGQQDPPFWAPDLPFRQRRRDAEGE